MGFRELSSFNMAMLGKQVWRIIQNPNSLLSRILEAKYFPEYDVLDANLLILMLLIYTWKSIFGAIRMVKHGLVWRIGNG